MREEPPTLFNKEMGKYFYQDWHDYYTDIVKIVPSGSYVLDVGCGRGGLAEYLIREKDCRVKCLDLSDEAIEACKAKGLDIIKFNLNTNDELPGTYDVIIFASSLESLIDPLFVLSNVRSNLNNNGFLIVWVPNFSCFSSRIRYLLGKNVKSFGSSKEERKLGICGYDDIQFFNRATLSLVLRKTGYEPIEWFFRKPKLTIGGPIRFLKSAVKMLLYFVFRGRVLDLFSPFLLVKARKI